MTTYFIDYFWFFDFSTNDLFDDNLNHIKYYLLESNDKNRNTWEHYYLQYDKTKSDENVISFYYFQFQDNAILKNKTIDKIIRNSISYFEVEISNEEILYMKLMNWI